MNKSAEAIQQEIQRLQSQLGSAKKRDAAQAREKEARRIEANTKTVMRAATRSGLIKSTVNSKLLEEKFREIVARLNADVPVENTPVAQDFVPNQFTQQVNYGDV